MRPTALVLLGLLVAVSDAPAAARLGAYTDPYLINEMRTDYTHHPNEGDRTFTFRLNDEVPIKVGPQSDFDRHYEVTQRIHHAESKIRMAALKELHRTRTMESARQITSLLGDSHYEIRETAAWMLGDLGYKSAIRPLIDSLEYTYGPATQTIAASLRKLTGKHYGSSYRRWWTWYEAVRRDQ